MVWNYSMSTFNKQVNVSDNSASDDCGGIAVWSYSISTFNERAVFSNNSAGDHGGGMVVWHDSVSTFNGQVEFLWQQCWLSRWKNGSAELFS